jgi:hypothetical protein
MDATGSSKSGLLFLLCWGCGAGLGALPMPGAAPFEVFCFLVGCSMARMRGRIFGSNLAGTGGKDVCKTRGHRQDFKANQGMTRPLVVLFL